MHDEYVLRIVWTQLENIAIVRVSFTCILPTSIQRCRLLAARNLPLKSNITNYFSYAIQHKELVPHSFDSFSTTLHDMHYICPSNGTVLRYAPRLEINGQPLYRVSL